MAGAAENITADLKTAPSARAIMGGAPDDEISTVPVEDGIETDAANRTLDIVETLRATIPGELKNRQQFCARAGKRPFVKVAGAKRLTPNWKPCPENEWMTFDQALSVVEEGVVLEDEDGHTRPASIGFLTARTDPQIVGGDLDRCRDPDTGFITPSIVRILVGLRPFYVEVSPSGCGIRFFCHGDLPNGKSSMEGTGPLDDMPPETWERIKKVKPDSETPNGLELYTAGRHLSLTGDKLDEYCADEPAESFDFEVVRPWIVNKDQIGKSKKVAEKPIPNPTSKPSPVQWEEYKPDTRGHYCTEALKKATDEVRNAPKGKRNKTLNNQALAMGTLVAAGYLNESKVQSELVRAAMANGLSQNESQATFKSGFSAGQSKPRDLSDKGCSLESPQTEAESREPSRTQKTTDPQEPRDLSNTGNELEFILEELKSNSALICDKKFLGRLASMSDLDREYLLGEARSRKIIGVKKTTILDEIAKLRVDHKGESPAEIDPQTREKAQAILETDIINAVKKEVNKNIKSNNNVPLLTLFAGASAFMGDPIHADISGLPELGKSTEVAYTLSLFPQDRVKVLSEASPKSLYYFAEKVSLDGWIIYIDDAREEHIPVLKAFRNDGPVTPANLTVVDGESINLVVKGRPAVIASSVLPLRDFEEQASSRAIQESITAPSEWVEAEIHRRIRERIRLGPLFERPNEESKKVIQAAMQILRDEGIKDVVCPFDAPEPEGLKRRATGQFQRLIKVSAFLNQMRRPVLVLEDGTKLVLAVYEDLQIAADVWFRFNLGQKFKIGRKHAKLLELLPTEEPGEGDYDSTNYGSTNYGSTDGSKGTVASIASRQETIGSQKTIGRYIEDLYDAGLAFRKQIRAPGNPYSYWVDKELRQNVLSEISGCGETLEYLGQAGTKKACLKYVRKNCPDSLKSSIYEFFSSLRHKNLKIIEGEKDTTNHKKMDGVRGVYEKLFAPSFSENPVSNAENGPPIANNSDTGICPKETCSSSDTDIWDKANLSEIGDNCPGSGEEQMGTHRETETAILESAEPGAEIGSTPPPTMGAPPTQPPAKEDETKEGPDKEGPAKEGPAKDGLANQQGAVAKPSAEETALIKQSLDELHTRKSMQTCKPSATTDADGGGARAIKRQKPNQAAKKNIKTKKITAFEEAKKNGYVNVKNSAAYCAYWEYCKEQNIPFIKIQYSRKYATVGCDFLTVLGSHGFQDLDEPYDYLRQNFTLMYGSPKRLEGILIDVDVLKSEAETLASCLFSMAKAAVEREQAAAAKRDSHMADAVT